MPKTLDYSPTFCPMPFNHQFVGPDWVKKPCSRFLFPEIDHENYEEFMAELRRYKMEGKRHPGCRKCFEEEDAGRKRSLRQIHLEVEGFNYPMTYDLDPDDPKIRWLELSFSNRCNVRCRMCGPFYSTNWYQDWLEVPEYAFGVPGVGKDPEKIKAWLDANGNKPQPFNLEELDPHIPNLRLVKMTGGEPFIIPEYQKILERIDEIGNAEGMWLNYSTNLTVRPKAKLKELWKKYEKVMFATSLDGIGNVIEYQRHPTKWEMVDTVMNDLMQIPNSWVGVRTTQTIYNILDMPNVAHYFAELEDKYNKPFSEDSWLNFVQASTPEFLSITVLPKWAKDIVAERLAWSAPSQKIQDNFDQLVNYMYNEDNSHLLPKFADYTRKLDKARGEDFTDIVPEFAELLAHDERKIYDMKYEDFTKADLGTRRQRPMYISEFHKFRARLDMATYPSDPCDYCNYTFIPKIDEWIKSHERVKYHGLDTFPVKDTILGVTQVIDELHQLHGNALVVWEGEYKYHRRLTDWKINEINDYKQLKEGDVFIASMPSCITTNSLPEFDKLLDHCQIHNIPVHIDGAWFGQCRDFELDVSHPAIKTVSVSLSKAFGMGSQRIGIRYSREEINGPIHIMNDFGYQNVSDAWIGVQAMEHFGPDFWWRNYEEQYEKVCADFGLMESDSIHVGWGQDGNYYGIRTPLRFLIENHYDERGTDRGLNEVERNEK